MSSNKCKKTQGNWQNIQEVQYENDHLNDNEQFQKRNLLVYISQLMVQ